MKIIPRIAKDVEQYLFLLRCATGMINTNTDSLIGGKASKNSTRIAGVDNLPASVIYIHEARASHSGREAGQS